MVEKEGNGMTLEGVQTVGVPVHWVNEGEKRLDASFYARDVIAAKILIEKVSQHLEVQYITDISNQIFWPGRFKRHYVSKKEGKPFLIPSEVFMFLPKPTKYVIDYPPDVEIKRDWILITRSGTVGRVIISTKYLENFVLSDDLIRVVPKDDSYGFLYTYLNTWIGQAFLTKDQYGATVKHIEPHHVKSIPIPRIPDLEEEINKKILEAHKLREEAQELLLKAEEMIYSELGLPKIDEEDVEYFDGELGKLVKAFEVKASELDYRLDASYHVPIIKQIEKNLSKSDVKIETLGNKLKKIFIPPRFKRPYVKNQDVGIRYIRPSDLPMIKYFEPKYLAKKFKNCDLYRLKEGDILVVTDGSIGWVSIVTPFIAGWYGSNNFARIAPTEDVNRGYLLAYLLSPYGQYQLKREIFGGVIDHLTEDHICQIKIPIPQSEIQEKIGSLVIEAYNKKDKANQIEEEAVRKFEETLIKIAEG